MLSQMVIILLFEREKEGFFCSPKWWHVQFLVCVQSPLVLYINFVLQIFRVAFELVDKSHSSD